MAGDAGQIAEGPYFDELAVGMVFDQAPALTLTSGQAGVHQAILADRLRLPLDETLAKAVTGAQAPLAHPALVWDVAIGQSTVVTHHVVANLFYRGLAFHRAPVIGDTLRTSTEVVGLRQNRAKPGRRPTGLAALRITTVDQHERPVLDFWRCAMLPLRDPEARTGHADDLDAVGQQPDAGTLAGLTAGWRLDRFRNAVSGTHFADLRPDASWRVGGGDVVSSAPELARLTLNVASAHHDAGERGRLVYGGHTIGLAASQLTRALPNVVTVAGWHGCDHTGPVHEGDTLHSEVHVERTEPLPDGAGLAHLRVRVRSTPVTGAEPADVLDWRPIAVLA
ncbi:MAG: acyl dehydratase [Pseudonocardiaceae bacterium]|nr:acyl dehydratase [Pseudonocardiaceae bacterium]